MMNRETKYKITGFGILLYSLCLMAVCRISFSFTAESSEVIIGCILAMAVGAIAVLVLHYHFHGLGFRRKALLLLLLVTISDLLIWKLICQGTMLPPG
ncbi:MAG TPA: hypothetical protein VFW78_11250 [Bacteroidia bacterium]|nr:hypothetical protein [Bacteroidia bacterium]